jgi:hypothetical protein
MLGELLKIVRNLCWKYLILCIPQLLSGGAVVAPSYHGEFQNCHPQSTSGDRGYGIITNYRQKFLLHVFSVVYTSSIGNLPYCPCLLSASLRRRSSTTHENVTPNPIIATQKPKNLKPPELFATSILDSAVAVMDDEGRGDDCLIC